MAAVGDLLAGRYELRSVLGRGGMAEVFRALDTRLGREVAVKVLASHLLADPRSVERFEREGRTAAALHHPNVVDVYDAASEGDTHYLVMELVEGPTLADVMTREGKMPVPRALDIAGRMASALQVAHDRNLVHHDVKPSNVLFDADGNVKVADFGIARAASSDITTVQGSPPYVAPEQAKGGRADPRSDVYGLGCVLFEMLAGRPPFVGDNASAVIMQHLESPPPRVSQFRDDLPDHVDDVVMRALAKDPAQRYESAQAFRADIDRVAAGLPVSHATIVSTRHLEPAHTLPVAHNGSPPRFEPPREATRSYTQYQVPDPTPDRRRARGLPGLQVLTVVLLVVLLAVLAYAALNDTRVREQPVRDTADAPQDEPQDEPQPEPQADAPEPDADTDGDAGFSIGRAAERVRSLLEGGRNADEATGKAVEQLQKDLEDAIDDRVRGDAQGAADRIQSFRERLDELTEKQEIGADLADRLRRTIDEVRPFQG